MVLLSWLAESPVSFRQIIRDHGLEANPNGGWYRQSYLAESPEGGRALATIIRYMLTSEGRACTPHRTSAECLHYFHQGSPITVLTIDPDGAIQRTILGPDLRAGQELQVVVPGHCWKGFLLEQGDYGLISEAVVPGYSPDDDEVAEAGEMRARFPQAWPQLAPFFQAAR